MKLLFENWRNFLNERKTDELYLKIVNFFTQMVLTEDMFTPSPEEGGAPDITPEEMERFLSFIEKHPSMVYNTDPETRTEEDEARLLSRSLDFYFDEIKIKQMWHQYHEYIPEDDKFFINENVFFNSLIALELRIVYEPENKIFGSFEVYEEKGAGKIEFNFGSPGAHVTPEMYMEMNDYEAFKILKESEFELKNLMDHELTHFLNHVRTKEVATRTKRIARPGKRSREKAYINSTEEIQARLIDLFSLIERYLNKEKLNLDAPLERYINALSLNLVEKNKTNIIKLLIGINKGFYSGYWEATTESNKKRILSRIYDFYNHLVSKADSYASVKKHQKEQ